MRLDHAWFSLWVIGKNTGLRAKVFSSLSFYFSSIAPLSFFVSFICLQNHLSFRLEIAKSPNSFSFYKQAGKRETSTSGSLKTEGKWKLGQ